MSTTATELRTLTLFEGCEPEDLEGVASAITETRHVVEGEVLCREGEPADRWWIVADGMADATVGGLYVGTIGPGETIGELALLDGQPRGATVTATSAMVLHEVSGAGFVGALLASPRLSLALLRQLATRIRSTNERPPRPQGLPRGAARVRDRSPALDVSELDPRADGYAEDPHVQLNALRERAPVHWSATFSSHVVTRYDDVHRLIRDHSLIGSISTVDPGAASAGRPDEKAKARRVDKMMIRRNGEDHTRLRRLVSKVFTPKAIAAWRDRAEAVTERLLSAAAEQEKLDVMSEYAAPLPVTIISEMLGMPSTDVPQLREWSHLLVRGLDPLNSPELEQAIADAGRAMFHYLEQVVEDKRTHPADDILTALIHAEESGQSLDAEEVQAQVMLLYIAGHETTTNLIGNGLTDLFAFRDQLELLRSDSALDANAIEEVLRFDGPALYTRRVTTNPIEVGGLTIPGESLLTLCLAGANRDPRKWGDDADVLDIARPGANEHVSFGGGPHYCLGASLARMEGQIALPRLVRRFPRMEPAYEHPAWSNRVILRGLDNLPVVLR